jgi:hypothetical protein
VLRDGLPMAYISSLEAVGTNVIVESSKIEVACTQEEDISAAPNSTGNVSWTTFGRVMPDGVWSGNDEFMGFPVDHASSPASE